jgi:hypothetical protein
VSGNGNAGGIELDRGDDGVVKLGARTDVAQVVVEVYEVDHRDAAGVLGSMAGPGVEAAAGLVAGGPVAAMAGLGVAVAARSLSLAHRRL